MRTQPSPTSRPDPASRSDARHDGDAIVDGGDLAGPAPAASEASGSTSESNASASAASPPGGGAVRRSRRVRVLQVVAVVALLLVGYYLVTLWQVWSTGRSDQARPVDAIVVLGAAQYDGRPSPQLAARLDHVVELWPEGLAPTVVVTGGNQPGDRFTEAEASAAYLTDRGIPGSAILMEDTGSTTYASLAQVAELVDADEARVLIVTDPYHALRSRLTAQELGLTAYVSPTDTSVVTGGESVRRHVQEAAGIALGRLIGFSRLSDLTD